MTDPGLEFKVMISVWRANEFSEEMIKVIYTIKNASGQMQLSMSHQDVTEQINIAKLSLFISCYEMLKRKVLYSIKTKIELNQNLSRS